MPVFRAPAKPTPWELITKYFDRFREEKFKKRTIVILHSKFEKIQVWVIPYDNSSIKIIKFEIVKTFEEVAATVLAIFFVSFINSQFFASQTFTKPYVRNIKVGDYFQGRYKGRLILLDERAWSLTWPDDLTLPIHLKTKLNFLIHPTRKILFEHQEPPFTIIRLLIRNLLRLLYLKRALLEENYGL